MDVKEAEEYIRIMLRDKDIPDGAKTISYVYAKEAIEIVLAELEKKDNEIEELKKRVPSMDNMTYLGDYEGILKIEQELIKRDKIIDAMAKYMASGNYYMYATAEDIKEDFTNKVEKEGK